MKVYDCERQSREAIRRQAEILARLLVAAKFTFPTYQRLRRRAQLRLAAVQRLAVSCG